MRDLPTELVCCVFELLSFADRISATHICKRWRRIALGHGRLWSSIWCQDVDTLATLLERAHRVHVDVQVTGISLANLEETVALIGAHMDHIRLLSLHAGDATLDLDCVSIVHRGFARATPLLEVVDIQLFDQPFPKNIADEVHEAHVARGPCSVPEDSFLHRAPRLHQLSFRTMTLPDDAADVFSNVTTLELDAICLSAPQLRALVSLPLLRSLHLEVVECELPRTPAPSTFKLDRLWMYGPYSTPWDQPVDPLLRYLGFPHIRHFTTDWPALWPEMASPPRSLPHALLIERWKVDRGIAHGEAWRLVDDAGFITDLLDVDTSRHLDQPDTEHVLAHIGELVIVYYELRRAVNYIVEFHNLSRLCVRMSAADCETSVKRNATGISVPQLRTLELWGGIDEAPVVIRATDVLSLVRDFLIPDPGHPPELVLRDVRIAHSGEELAQLAELVTGIRCPDGPAPASFVVEFKSSWHAAVQR